MKVSELEARKRDRKNMRGIGGPLLCIGDLLSDVGEESSADPDHHVTLPSSTSNSEIDPQSLDLTRLFEGNYENLNKALAGSDHSWTAMTLQLCTSLETANKLLVSTNNNVRSMSEKVQELEKIIKKGDSTVAAARALLVARKQKGGASKTDNDPGRS